MSLTAAILILISAFSHAGWNLLSKNRHPSGAFFFFATSFAVIFLSPLFILFRKEVALIPSEIWTLIVCSGFFMALYYFTLAGAYRNGDISLVYPLARSSPIIVVTFVSLVMGKSDEIGFWALIGIVMVVTGCFLLPLKTFKDFSIRNYLHLYCFLSLLAAIGTAGYTIIDDHALSLMRGLPDNVFNPYNTAFLYLFLEGTSCLLWMGFGILFIKNERKKFVSFCCGGHKEIMLSMVAGIGIFGTYGLVLSSMAFVRNVSYVAAFRQISIPIGAFLGMILLREPRYITRITGVLIILSGLILVVLG